MGSVELDPAQQVINIYSHIITYGDGAEEDVSERMRREIEMMWNEPEAMIWFREQHWLVRFHITAEAKPAIDQLEVIANTDPRNNYFRVENFVHGNISFVDGLGCNTGYFLTENLYEGSTTAAHEYGHSLGLDHPVHLDIRGHGIPGIMYPRGTLVDPVYQYDALKPAGATGGTMHPRFRKVKTEDIEALKLHKLIYKNGEAVLGGFTNIYHWKHA